MSGEFRDVYSCHFVHDALTQFTDDGTHEVSRALANLYRAVAPVERACASTEAFNMGHGHPYLELFKQIANIEKAVLEINEITKKVSGIMDEAFKERQP